jgi:hypothetical protein
VAGAEEEDSVVVGDFPVGAAVVDSVADIVVVTEAVDVATLLTRSKEDQFLILTPGLLTTKDRLMTITTHLSIPTPASSVFG